MASQINISTELNDETFHFTRTAVYSFLQHNPWFDGTILYLTTDKKPISYQNLILIQRIYSKISILKLEECDQLSNFQGYLLDTLLKYQLFFQSKRVFYFTNRSLFTKNIENIISDDSSKFTQDLNLFFLNRDYEFKDEPLPKILDILKSLEAVEFDHNVYTNSNQIQDKKFKQLYNLINHVSVIFYLGEMTPETSKIYQIWLHKNREASQYSEKPVNTPRASTINQSTSNNLKISKVLKAQSQIDYINPLTQKMINSVNQINGQQIFESYEKTVDYFRDKNICLVANSAELLKYQYGEFIDSHDIIIRFNGYKILPEKTGFRTDVHCVFRTFFESSVDYIDYKIVISSNVNHWLNTILKFHSKDAITKKYKLLDFNYPSGQQLSKAKCGNIKIPTSGLAAFVFLHSLGIAKNVKLIGFNAYNGGDSTAILRNNNDDQLAGAHDYQLEQAYWSTRFDEVLPGVLKFKY